MEYQCNFCGSIFSNSCNLSTHKRSAKYCLAIQGTKASKTNKCVRCNKVFNHASSLIKHKQVCKGPSAEEIICNLNDKVEDLEGLLELKTNETINGLKEELKETKQKLAQTEKTIIELNLKLAEDKGQIKVYKERPIPTINNYINPKLLQIKCDTIRPFTIETVREDIQAGKFTFDRFIQAEKGLLEFISDIIAKDTEFSYVCTDSSRQKFHRLLESREWKDDNGATFLNKVLDELKEPTTEYYKRITDMMVSGDRDTADFLRAKTKNMVMGITSPKSKSREITFTKLRNEVKNLATI